MRPWTVTNEGLRLALRVTPKARREAIGSVVERPDGARLDVAVNAPPEDGKANAAVVVLLAKALGVAKGNVRVVQGASSRQKLVLITGDGSAVIGRLEALLSAGGKPR
jgi:uncharacterized protein (TIGR00251 family)